jgi:hypothetical protein
MSDVPGKPEPQPSVRPEVLGLLFLVCSVFSLCFALRYGVTLREDPSPARAAAFFFATAIIFFLRKGRRYTTVGCVMYIIAAFFVCAGFASWMPA